MTLTERAKHGANFAAGCLLLGACAMVAGLEGLRRPDFWLLDWAALAGGALVVWRSARAMRVLQELERELQRSDSGR